MESFLKSIADTYIENYKADLSEVCFVFPGKRAGTFFTKHICECLKKKKKTALLPQVTSIAELVENLSGRVIDSRIDQICLLYDLYCRIIDKEAPKAPFDKFQSWADTILSDFNDVEMYCVDPQKLFPNVRNLKEIRANYLTKEQLEVMRKYLGYSETEYSDSGNLWKHYSGSSKKMTRRFFSLFDLLGKLYYEFCEALEQRGLTFPGRAYSQALNVLLKDAAAALPYKRVVMVGFNALSTVEFYIFQTLAKAQATLSDGSTQRLGDFYFDCTGKPLADEANIGRHFIDANRKHNLSSIYELAGCDTDSLPDVLHVIASPSGIAQAKIAGQLLGDIMKRRENKTDENQNDAEVAVVLPDEKLLIPMLYSMPKDISGPNLTMGYSFSLTNVATFISLIEKYQLGLRLQNNDWTANTADVDALLANPLMPLLIGKETCCLLAASITRLRRPTIAVRIITSADNDVLKTIFTPFGFNASSDKALDYLRTILELLAKRMEETSADSSACSEESVSGLEISHVYIYLEALERLRKAFMQYNISTGAAKTFSLASGLLASEMVHFEGEPLRGVQVMGPLETRSLDFKYIIIPSMNERIYPRKLNTKSFIPAVVRKDFGMATSRFQEAIFTYYFYRMISRAKEVYLIYDSRTTGLHSGAPSRFILQLEHLYAKDAVKHFRYRFDLTSHQRKMIEISKRNVSHLISEYFTPHAKKKLSATSLNDYIKCPLLFYLKDLRGVREESTPQSGLQANEQGTIVHDSLKSIFDSLSGRNNGHITREILEKTADNHTLLKQTVKSAIDAMYYDQQSEAPQPPESEIGIFIPRLIQSVKNVLRFDAANIADGYLEIVELEKKNPVTFTFPEGTTVNFNFIIDRLDRIHKTDGTSTLRVVDYKTGGYSIKANSVEELFESDHASELIQLLLYSLLYQEMTGIKEDIQPVIYDISKMHDPNNKEALALPKINKQDVTTSSPCISTFLKLLEEKLLTLADTALPFRQAPEGAKACIYCPFALSICDITP